MAEYLTNTADLTAVADRMVRVLKAKGCDVIVAMSHAGLYADRALAASTCGVHAIVGGHSHDLMTKPEIVEGPGGWKTIIGQAGSMCRYLGVMTVRVKDGALDAANSGWTVRELTKDVPQDFKVSLIIDLRNPLFVAFAYSPYPFADILSASTAPWMSLRSVT